MYCEAEAAFEGADVVLKEVRVFVKIDSFEGEFAETFTSVSVGSRVRCYPSTAELGASSVLKGIVSLLVSGLGLNDGMHTW